MTRFLIKRGEVGINKCKKVGHVKQPELITKVKKLLMVT